MPLKIMRTLPAQKVNPGIRAAYRRELDGLMREMSKAVISEIIEEYGRIQWRVAPEMAEDAKWRSPAQIMIDFANKLLASWKRKFVDKGTIAAKQALKGIYQRIKQHRKRELKKLGITIEINPSRFTSSRYQALFLENVSLISTIPDEFFNSLKTTINNAIVQGLDRAQLAEDLYQKFSPPTEKGWDESRWHKHCVFIARDQTSKAVQALAESTDLDMGITEGIWIHVPGRLSSRVSHVYMGRDKTPFKLSEGKYDREVDRMVKPAELYNCMCTYRAVIPDTWRA